MSTGGINWKTIDTQVNCHSRQIKRIALLGNIGLHEQNTIINHHNDSHFLNYIQLALHISYVL